jgi:hypothetical protein
LSPAITLRLLSDQTIDLNARFTVTAVATGGTGGFTYTGSGLPTGVSVNSTTGSVSGNPTDSGRFLATVTATDGNGGTAAQTFVVIVTTNNSLIFTAPALTAPDQTTAKGRATSLTLTTNVTSPVLSIAGLPAGMTLNTSTGVISGTPTTSGLYKVTATARTMSPSRTSILMFTWTVT